MHPPSASDASGSRYTEFRMASAASELTVGEVTAKVRMPRVVLWLLAIYAPSLFIAFTLFMAYQFCSMDTVFATSVPWRFVAIMMWGIYMTLVTALVMYMHLCMPRVPFAVREALVNVGVASIGLPLLFIVLFVVGYGHMWMFIVLVCILAILIASVLRMWVWLVSTYT
ncbi:unnamed protein product [Urochloa humidicola]